MVLQGSQSWTKCQPWRSLGSPVLGPNRDKIGGLGVALLRPPRWASGSAAGISYGAKRPPSKKSTNGAGLGLGQHLQPGEFDAQAAAGTTSFAFPPVKHLSLSLHSVSSAGNPAGPYRERERERERGCEAIDEWPCEAASRGLWLATDRQPTTPEAFTDWGSHPLQPCDDMVCTCTALECRVLETFYAFYYHQPLNRPYFYF